MEQFLGYIINSYIDRLIILCGFERVRPAGGYVLFLQFSLQIVTDLTENERTNLEGPQNTNNEINTGLCVRCMVSYRCYRRVNYGGLKKNLQNQNE